MAFYIIATNVKAVQTIANIQNTAGTTTGTNLIAQPVGPNGNVSVPTQSQAFQLNVSGTGSVSATMQPVVSNDGTNWSAYGATVTATGFNGGSNNIALTNAPFIYFSAYITAISGTGATASINMSA